MSDYARSAHGHSFAPRELQPGDTLQPRVHFSRTIHHQLSMRMAEKCRHCNLTGLRNVVTVMPSLARISLDRVRVRLRAVVPVGVPRICRKAGNPTGLPGSQGSVLFPGDGAVFERAALPRRDACHHCRGKRKRDPDIPCEPLGPRV